MENPTLMLHPLAPHLAAMHVQALLDEAENGRRARLVPRPTPTTSALRRNLGNGARRASTAFASAARSIDPGPDADCSPA